MLYKDICKLSNKQFRRLTGVKIDVFNLMVTVVREDKLLRMKRGGRKTTKLSTSDEVLLMLEYWRENRTYFHIAQSRGISESQAWKIVRRCEDALIKSSKFGLKGKKALINTAENHEVILIDATETPVERPKKTKESLLRKEKTPHYKNTNRS